MLRTALHYHITEQLTHKFIHNFCGHLTVTELGKQWTIGPIIG
jgi:hypothetical protein